MTTEATEKKPENKLSEGQLAELQAAHKKIATIDWNGHTLVFRRPTRDECHNYRVALENPETKADANDQIAQRTIIAFDLTTDVIAARTYFTDTFLKEESPMFMATAKAKIMMGALMGLVEEEDLADLGKGVSVRPSPPTRTQAA